MRQPIITGWIVSEFRCRIKMMEENAAPDKYIIFQLKTSFEKKKISPITNNVIEQIYRYMICSCFPLLLNRIENKCVSLI